MKNIFPEAKRLFRFLQLKIKVVCKIDKSGIKKNSIRIKKKKKTDYREEKIMVRVTK